MKLIFLIFTIFHTATASKVLLRLNNGKENLVQLREIRKGIVFISPVGKSEPIVQISQDSTEFIAEEHLCIDPAQPFFDPLAPRWDLASELQDSLLHPKVEITLKSGKSNLARFYKKQDDIYFLAGHLPNGKLRILPIFSETILRIKFPDGRYLTQPDQAFNLPNDYAKLTPPSSYFSVSARPSDAQVYVNGIDKGEAPLGLSKVNPGTYLVEGRFNSPTDTLYGRRKINLRDWDTLQVNLRLKKETPLLLLRTQPPGTEVYFGNNTDFSQASPFKTPLKYKIQSGPQLITLFHPQKEDTTFLTNIDPLKPTLIDVNLAPLKRGSQIEREDLLFQRNKRTIFNILQASSIPLVLSGGIWFLQAQANEDIAKEKRAQLLTPAVRQGSHYQSLQRDNLDHYNLSLKQNQTGWALLLTGILIQGVAWTFYF